MKMLFQCLLLAIAVVGTCYVMFHLEPDSRTRAMFDLRGKCHAMGGQAKLDSNTETVICYRQYIDQNRMELFRANYYPSIDEWVLIASVQTMSRIGFVFDKDNSRIDEFYIKGKTQTVLFVRDRKEEMSGELLFVTVTPYGPKGPKIAVSITLEHR